MRVSVCLSGCMLLVLSTVGAAICQDTNFTTGPQYLLTQGSSAFARSISTPSLSLSAPPLEVGASNATAGLATGADDQTPTPRRYPDANLFPIYYGATRTSIIEISFSEVPRREFPASILDTGVWQTTTEQGLRQRGYGVTVAEAARSKAQTRHAKRVYTNDDIDRLRGGS